MRALAADELANVNLDIPSAVTTVLGALPEIKALRAPIVAMMPQFDIGRFDKLEAYTLAVGYANSLYLAASEPSESIENLVARRDLMRAVERAMEAFVRRARARRILDLAGSGEWAGDLAVVREDPPPYGKGRRGAR
jgi:hypothetical protein